MGETVRQIQFKQVHPSIPFFQRYPNLGQQQISEAGFLAIGPLLARMGPPAIAFIGGIGRRFLPKGQTFLSQAWSGFSGKVAALSQSAWTSLSSPQYWTRFAKIGSISAALRAGYDWVDEKEVGEIRHNALLAFVGGGLCGGLIPKIPLSPSPFVQRFISPALGRAIPFNYVGLDLLGDFSKNYLVDIRNKLGSAKGLAMTGTLLTAENGLATLAFLPFLGSWTKAAKTALTVTTISIGMETYLQHSSGKEWNEIDPGRFVGMSAWGHSIVVLPEAILGGAVKAMGLTQAVARTTELGMKYVVFVNPSVNNFAARINNQNWENVQIGNTARHATVMWLARFIQSTLGPSHPVAMLADEGIGAAAIGLVNEVWPFYEGVPEVWSQGFLQRVRALKTKTGREDLTDYLSHEMGSWSFKEGKYLPSPLNLEEAKKLVAKRGDQTVADLFEGYLLSLHPQHQTVALRDF